MLVVADSSALIALTVSQGLWLLPRLFETIRVPVAVYDEVVVDGRPAADELRSFLQDRVLPVDWRSYVVESGTLGRGELEAMALYRELRADALLVDDRRARSVARLNGISIVGSIGILIRAGELDLIPAIRPYLARLRASDIHVTDRLIAAALRIAGEPPAD